MIAADRLWLLSLALVLDAMVGDPDLPWRRIPHPVVLIGRLVAHLDRTLNRETLVPAQRRLAGAVAVLILVTIAGIAGWALETLFGAVPYGWIGTVAVAAVMLAGRGLYDHVAAVAAAYEEAGIAAARRATAKIVGRDPDRLDEAGVGRAAIESAAENFSDGLIAPALWFLALGLPGLLAYKAVNTADSMIGHRSERHRDFGWAAARLDDLVNWPAARLAGVLIALAAPLAGNSIGQALRVMAADARQHRSPNAGWPEAAMAAALGVALAGPRVYAGRTVDDAVMNEAGRRAAIADIGRALKVYAGAWAAFFLIVLVAALVL